MAATEETHSATAAATATTDKKEMEQDVVSLVKETTTEEDKNLGNVSNPGLSEDKQTETLVVDTKETVEPEKESPVVGESVEKVEKHETPELPVASETKDEGKNEPVEPKEVNQVEESHEVVEKDVQEIDGDSDKRVIEQPVVEDVSGEPQLTTSKFVDASETAFEVKEEKVEPTEENPVEEKPAEASEKAQEGSERSEVVSAEAKEPAAETGLNPEEQSEAAGHVGGANDLETETKTVPDVQTVNVKEVLVENVENSVTDVKSTELEGVPEKETEEVVLGNQEAIPEVETKEAEKEEEISKKEKLEVNEERKPTIINNDAAEEKFIVEEKNCKEVEPAAKESGTQEKENAEKAVETKPEVEETEISAPEVETKEVRVKPASKHSNIMSKVKQSFVKAKKAIIGKSQSSKTISTEAKGEIKVK